MQHEASYLSESDSLEREKTFEEKIQGCEEDLERVLDEEVRGKNGEKLKKEREKIEAQYIRLVCEANEYEFMYWYDNSIKELRENMSERMEPEDNERLITKFLLCRRAKDTRESH